MPARRLMKMAKNSQSAMEASADVAACLVKTENSIAIASQKQIYTIVYSR